MSSAEFAAWMAYDRISPLPDRRLDQLAAMLASVIAEVMTGKRHKIAIFDIFDPQRKGGLMRPRTIEDQKSEMKQLTRMMRGTVIRHGDNR